MHPSAHRMSMAVATDRFIGGLPGTEKRRRRVWRERVDNAGASFVWRAPTSSRVFRRSRTINGLLYAREKEASEWTDSGMEATERADSGVRRGEEDIDPNMSCMDAGQEGRKIGKREGLRPSGSCSGLPLLALDLRSVRVQQVERQLGAGSRRGWKGDRDDVAALHRARAAKVRPLDAYRRRGCSGHGHCDVSAIGAHVRHRSRVRPDTEVHLVVRLRDGRLRRRDRECPGHRIHLRHGAERHEGLVPANWRDQARHHDVQHRGEYHRNGDHQDGRDHGRHRSFILLDDAPHGIVLPGSFRRHVWTGGLSLLNVSWLMFNSENHFIKGPASTFGKRRFEVRTRRTVRSQDPEYAPSSIVSSDTRTSMFRISSVSYSCMEKMTV